MPVVCSQRLCRCEQTTKKRFEAAKPPQKPPSCYNQSCFGSVLITKGLRDMPDNIAPNFAPFEARMRREGIAQIVIDNFRHYYGVLAGGSVGLIAESQIAPVETARDIAELARYHDAGRQALQHAAVLKLNGGL